MPVAQTSCLQHILQKWSLCSYSHSSKTVAQLFYLHNFILLYNTFVLNGVALSLFQWKKRIKSLWQWNKILCSFRTVYNLLYSVPQNGVEGYVKNVFKLKALVLPNSCILSCASNGSERATASYRSKSSCSYQIFHLLSVISCSNYREVWAGAFI